MPQPDHISKLGVPDPATLDDDLKVIWNKCVDKLGFVPNVFSAYSLKPRGCATSWRCTTRSCCRSPACPSWSGRWSRSSCRRPTAATTAWSRMARRCGAVRRSRTRRDDGAELPRREAGCAAARDAGLHLEADHDAVADRRRRPGWIARGGPHREDIFDLAETVAFFNLSNRMASATDMMPNREYHKAAR